jgi:hypothetical protein
MRIEFLEIAVILLLFLSLFLFAWVNILKKEVRENEWIHYANNYPKTE